MARRFWHRHPRLTRGIMLAFTFLTAFGVGFGYAAWALVCRGAACPSVEVLDEYTPRQTSKLYAADGRFLAEIGLERRTLIKLSEIPKVARDAFLITEDKRFYDHAGIDWIRFVGASLKNVRTLSYVEGFSTITMQLAGNIFPERINRRERSGTAALVRKLKEAKVARAIESRYTKDKIFELYLNQIYLGNGAHGIETAAQRYFGKSARNVNLAEAALLAALPKAPGRYDPRRNPDRALSRRNTILGLMHNEGVIGEADKNLARAYPLDLAQREEAGDVAPYYVEWIRQQLDEQFGRSLYEQGLKVYTTLDLDMQLAAERALEAQLRSIEAGKYGKFEHKTYEMYLAQTAGNTEAALVPNAPYLQGAFIAMDPRSGAVRALIGGRDFDDSKFNRATQALRQPGSTFKPIVYATAIQNGRPPSYSIDDGPLVVPQMGGEDWAPQNYDLQFMGPMGLRRALYLSRNLATVRLGMELGETTVIEMARKFGISTPIPPYPSIHIGAGDVYPIEMIAAYSAFATLGTRASPYAIVRVENAKGDVLWQPNPVKVQVMSPEEAWLMVDIMKDVIQHGTAYGSVWGAGFRTPAGGKTGTTNDGTDVWFIGYTADLVAGLWMGMDKPAKVKSNAQGGVLAAPAWTAFMTEVYRRKPAPPDWPRPSGLITRRVDRETGLLQNPFCPPEVVYTEFYIAGTEPLRECDLHSPFGFTTDSLGNPIVPDSAAASVVTPGTAPVPRPLPPIKASPPRDSNPFRLPPE